jgi:hypothetical protein
VMSITYSVKGRLDFSSAVPMQGELRGFRVEATSTEVRLFPIKQFDDYREALRAADRIIRDWEKYSALEHGEGAFRVHRESCDEIGPRGRRTRRPAFSNVLSFSATTLGEVRPDRLPKLPVGISFEGTAGYMLERFNRAMAGRAEWMPTGYFIYTGARLGHAGEKEAAAALGVTKQTLAKLRKTTSRSGGPLEGRKADSSDPLTAEERRWVQDTCCDLVLRVARLEAGSDPSGGE